MTNSNITVRYAPPSRFDVAPWATMCKVMLEGSDHDLYIQISKDETKPEWLKMRHLLEKAFEHFLADTVFIESCLEYYSQPDLKHLLQICEIIKNRS